MSARLEKLLLRALVGRSATITGPSSGDKAAQELAKTLQDAARRVLGRALSIREVDAGSCNGCELEIHALNNPVYDLERFGLKFVASPRHADVLLVTGPVTANMKTALERTYNATPAPKWVVALGDCACTGGLFKGSYACIGAVEDVLPVDLHIPGCPPRPVEILSGLVALIETASRGGNR
jgi:Ni,Fe-hydrogenase III small subunit